VALAGHAAAIVASGLTGGIAARAAGSDSLAATVVGQLGFWTVLVATVLRETPDHDIHAASRLGLRFQWVARRSGWWSGSQRNCWCTCGQQDRRPTPPVIETRLRYQVDQSNSVS